MQNAECRMQNEKTFPFFGEGLFCLMNETSGTGEGYRAKPNGVTNTDQPAHALSAATRRLTPLSGNRAETIPGAPNGVSNTYQLAHALAGRPTALLAAVAVFVVPIQIEQLVALLHGTAGVQIVCQLPQYFRGLQTLNVEFRQGFLSHP